MSLKDCCKNIENLIDQPTDKPDLTLRVCKICTCRHFELSVEVGKLGLEMT